MQDFMEKWNSDPRFKTKVKLSAYTLFVIFVAIFAISNRDNVSSNKLEEQYNNITQEEDEEENNSNSNIIEIPEEYDYIINVTVNENNYTYTGNKSNTRETIIKEIDGNTTNYIYENNSYYKEEELNYILTTKDEVYDVVDDNYLKLETINEYLLKSTKSNIIENEYLVYLKDIVLGNDSENYITIKKEDNKIKIDYTELIKNFDKTINNYVVTIEIEEKE